MEYIAIVHKDENSDFGVSFPDFPGCITAGRTVEEAQTLAVEALALHIAGMAEDGEALPEPSTLDQIANTSGKRVFGQNLLGIRYIAPDFDDPMSDEELKEWGY